MSDIEVFRWLNGLHGPIFDQVVAFLINDYLIPVAVALTLGWLWFAGRDDEEAERFQTAALVALIAMAFVTVFVQVTNAVWPRLRPFDALANARLLFYPPRDPSFPAHPVAILTAVGLSLYRSHRPVGITIVTVATMFGLLRIIAGVWFPSDVLGGLLYGAVGARLGWLLLRHVPGVATAVRSLADRLGLS